VRSGRNTLVFFNVIGRGFNHNRKKIEVPGGRVFNPDHESNLEFIIKTEEAFHRDGYSLEMHNSLVDNYWFRYQNHAQIVLTFNLKSFSEQKPKTLFYFVVVILIQGGKI
jgi:hypothetical protein